jgi:hypothetical protein
MHAALIRLARRAVVAAAHFAITEARLERRRDLKIRTHLENAVVGSARRRDRERLFETVRCVSM